MHILRYVKNFALLFRLALVILCPQADLFLITIPAIFVTFLIGDFLSTTFWLGIWHLSLLISAT